MTNDPPSWRIAAIVPAWNAAATLAACLRAIRAQTRPVDEFILFDDGSRDETAALAASLGFRVIGHQGAPAGPASGRNRAAQVAQADLLLFVDADVALAPDALEKLIAPLHDAAVTATFGSYDAHPPSRRLASLYTNLRHHFTHQTGQREASTFWSGMGLVRREAFLAAGGFDAARFPHPSIEDVELGARIIAAGGRIRLVPEARGAHWKDWRLRQLLHADIVRRALPWSLLIMDGRAASGSLNLARAEQWKALLSGGAMLCLLLGLWRPVALAGALALFGLYLIANRRFLGLVRREAGIRAAAAAAVLHCAYHFYAAAVFVLVALVCRLGLRRLRAPDGRPNAGRAPIATGPEP